MAFTVLTGRPAPLEAVAVLGFPLLFDAFFTLARRIAERQNVLTAHRDHLYQRAHDIGVSTWRIVGIYWGLSAACVGLYMLYIDAGVLFRITLLTALLVAGAVSVLAVRRLEVKHRTGGVASPPDVSAPPLIDMGRRHPQITSPRFLVRSRPNRLCREEPP
jgi:hypothetical protein